ncbi:MAG TPA: flagellar basal body P-ring formation chaperone FlgA [Bryobacteraceae bacterium]|nr:flagellar basal body P-ring formation chaperone FlgA [Bryobacteraceae bacterium]
MKLVLIFATCCAAGMGCQPVDAPNILGKDLAAASPSFAALDPAVNIASTPFPGVRRAFHSEELMRIARANQIDAVPPIAEVCFERSTAPLTVEQLLPVLERALGIDGAKIEILDFTRTGVPPGTLEFTRSSLSDAGLWRGRVKYDESHTTPVWARVRVTTEQTWIEAAEQLPPGKLLDATQLISRTGPRFPFGIAPIGSMDLAIGRTPIRTIKLGEPILLSMLLIPRAVERGENVAVEVLIGDARLSFDAVAESSGRPGESVLIKNPESGRYFQARVEAKGKVSVTK